MSITPSKRTQCFQKIYINFKLKTIAQQEKKKCFVGNSTGYTSMRT